MKFTFLIAVGILVFSCVQQPNLPQGCYLGCELPGDSAVLFSPNFINTGMMTRDIATTPDAKEFYFTVTVGGFNYAHIVVTKKVDGKWTKPEVADFAKNSKYKYYEPFISPDGEKFYFVSDMAEDFSGEPITPNVWVMNREENGWGIPYLMPELKTIDAELYFPSVANNGNFYFTYQIGRSSFIYMMEFKDGKYLEPVKMGSEINAGLARYNAVISANDSMMIVPTFGLPDTFGSTDYYISFKNKEGKWSKLINMGALINTENGMEHSANWSPDGKYLFFMRSKANKVISPNISFDQLRDIYLQAENGNGNIYWIDTGFISSLKAKATYNQTK